MYTFCDSHCQATSKEAGGAAVYAETAKAKKYAHLDPSTCRVWFQHTRLLHHIPTSGSILHHVLLTVWPHKN